MLDNKGEALRVFTGIWLLAILGILSFLFFGFVFSVESTEEAIPMSSVQPVAAEPARLAPAKPLRTPVELIDPPAVITKSRRSEKSEDDTIISSPEEFTPPQREYVDFSAPQPIFDEPNDLDGLENGASCSNSGSCASLYCSPHGVCADRPEN